MGTRLEVQGARTQPTLAGGSKTDAVAHRRSGARARAPGCLVDNGGCPNGVPCHQVDRRFYRITVPGDQYNPPREWCYRASGYCYGCLEAVASGAPYDAYKSGLPRAETCHSYGY